MSRIDTAREAASRAREQLAPYAQSAKDAATQHGGEAWQKVAPALGSAVEQARQAAQSRVQTQVVPLWEKGRGSVPPGVDEAVSKAARQAAQQAKVAARQAREAAEQARIIAQERVRPAAEQAAQQVHDRSLAALPVLRGQISLAEVEALTAAHERAARRGRWARRGVTLLALGALATGGLAAWRWYRKQSNPDWLVEPPTTSIPLRDTVSGAGGSSTGGSSASGAVNGSMPLDPEVEEKEAEEAAGKEGKKKP